MSRTLNRSNTQGGQSLARADGRDVLAVRYAEVAGDGAAFARALAHPAPPCVVANHGRIASAELEALLRAAAGGVEPVGWTPGGFRLAPDARPGLLWPAQAGLYQVQEEASMLPVRLLDPRPGDRILDLCAAPGSKTAQICMALEGRGTVVANDRESRRLAALRDKMKRLGLVNLTLTAYDGASYPLEAGPFDCVLVDAPCSSEGTSYSDGASYIGSSEGFRRWVGGQQRALLRRAAALVRPGGRIVYATCSLAPEENEAVVDAVLGEPGGALRAVAPPRLEGLRHGCGVEAWEGRLFHPDVVRHAVRLWPHLSGTGGFFAIVLERTGGGPAQETDGTEGVNGMDGAEREERPGAPPPGVLETLRAHYGLPADCFSGTAFWEQGKHLHARADGHRPPVRPESVASGIPFTRRGGAWPKPTTAAALLFGGAATRNVVEIDAEQTALYQTRRDVTPRLKQLEVCDGQGYVVLRRNGFALGLGFLRPGPPPIIESAFPRAWVPERMRGDAAGDAPRR